MFPAACATLPARCAVFPAVCAFIAGASVIIAGHLALRAVINSHWGIERIQELEES